VRGQRDVARKTLVALERQRPSCIEDKASTGPADALTQLLHGLAAGNANAFKPVAQDPDHDHDHDDDLED
jgi:hypothetical protein